MNDPVRRGKEKRRGEERSCSGVGVRAFGTVERADHEVHDAQVEELVQRGERRRALAPARRVRRVAWALGVRGALLLALDALHELLGLLVLRGHDVRDAQVREDDRRHLRAQCETRCAAQLRRGAPCRCRRVCVPRAGGRSAS